MCKHVAYLLLSCVLICSTCLTSPWRVESHPQHILPGFLLCEALTPEDETQARVFNITAPSTQLCAPHSYTNGSPYKWPCSQRQTLLSGGPPPSACANQLELNHCMYQNQPHGQATAHHNACTDLLTAKRILRFLFPWSFLSGVPLEFLEDRLLPCPFNSC